MRQQSFTAEDFKKYRKKTRKEVFLEEMDQIIPWQEMSEAVKRHYPAPKGAGRRPIGIERMLPIHFLQHWLSYPIPVLKKRYMIPGQCASLSALIWAKNRYRMKVPYSSFGT